MQGQIYIPCNESDFTGYLIWCRCTDCRHIARSMLNHFAVSFDEKREFPIQCFPSPLDSYTGCVLITKPGYEHNCYPCAYRSWWMHHLLNSVRIFYKELCHRYSKAMLLPVTIYIPHWSAIMLEESFYHFYILCILQQGASRLHADNMVMEMLAKVLDGITDYLPDEKISTQLKRIILPPLRKPGNTL